MHVNILLHTKPGFRSGKKVIRIKDEGIGISDDEKQKIFEPFFDLRWWKTWHGLGLSMSSGIIRLHKGEITIESEPGERKHF